MSAVAAGDQQGGHFAEPGGQVLRRVEYPLLGLRHGGVLNVVPGGLVWSRFVFGECLLVILCDCLNFLAVGDQHKTPALAVGAGGSLQGYFQALPDVVHIQRAIQVQALAYRAGRCQYFIGTQIQFGHNQPVSL